MATFPSNKSEIQNLIKSGLSDQESEKQLEEFGPNSLKEKAKKPAWKLFLGQFQDFMIVVLLVAALISGVAGEWTDSIIILIIVVLNAILGFIQEYRAEKAMESLKKMSEVQVQTKRNGQIKKIPSHLLVPGDLVFLEAGSMIPADMQLLEEASLQVDESSLTGESIPVEKSSLSEKINSEISIENSYQVFKGTMATHGRATAIVLKTGMETQLGKIADLLQEEQPKTPLQEKMEKFGKTISYMVLLICLLIFGLGILRGEEPLPLLLISVSLAVAAIPEALPALITIALSLGSARLAKKNSLIRKLPAVESLGSITFICTDKTGTLTKNQMTVQQVELSDLPAFSSNFSNLELAMGLNHDVKEGKDSELVGEATELALVNWVLNDLGEEKFHQLEKDFPRIGELPFDSDRKRMSTFHQIGDQVLILCKGAYEAIDDTLSTTIHLQTIKKTSLEWAKNGERVLAFSGKLIPSLPPKKDWSTLETELDFIGISGMIDPPREEAIQAIHECKTAGITPVMITGDHPETAKAIAQKVGILDEHRKVITGAELREIPNQEFEEMVESIAVYARVSPDQKLKIVKALQKKGNYVAMTGDGVNDAPSLRSSTIGVAMGITGTDVSKEAAHMILLDDNFATIVKAIREGRRIFDNIRKFVKYIMTCNGAEIWTIALAPFLGLPVPLLPVHILWINLVTDGVPALALAGEKAEKDIMKRPPRPPKQSLFAEGVGFHIVWVGILMAAVTLFTQYWAIRQGWHWQTMVFSVLAFSQLGHVMGVRSERQFLFQLGIFTNTPMIISIAVTLVLQLAVIYLPPLNDIFHTSPLSATELLFSGAMGLVVFHAVELEKWIKKLVKKS
ncbi:cation-translocating P-type ATPase [Algoriphagus zhangzhouensis]|uniref:Ca2+-transporting ATPase n=1 Tax=Algoriphagus zhangzhouensis TaxID=1073327 RepID=A0A1M7ZDA5_9BACT|nr:cation-translocating P-type ATPase [Algoriphagus zhangzhouensis]TDY45757.1 Ca2+-transporting ATPase [Algoriphagus zhangzhouensis]SHO62853.1 Ca2+-transporting ATPase [Algoriphagus zhangzhouensis]